MEEDFFSHPENDDRFTTGLLASVWQVKKVPNDDSPQIVHAVEIETRLEKAREKLQAIEARAKAAEERINRTEKRFNALKDSFELLRKEWNTYKKNKDN